MTVYNSYLFMMYRFLGLQNFYKVTVYRHVSLCIYKHVGVKFEGDMLSETQEPCFLSLMLQFLKVLSIFSCRQFTSQNTHCLVSKSPADEFIVLQVLPVKSGCIGL